MNPDILAMRLILAYLDEDPDTIAPHVWAVMAESGVPEEQFRVAACTAREAASWWLRDRESAEYARGQLTRKLDKLVAV